MTLDSSEKIVLRKFAQTRVLATDFVQAVLANVSLVSQVQIAVSVLVRVYPLVLYAPVMVFA